MNGVVSGSVMVTPISAKLSSSGCSWSTTYWRCQLAASAPASIRAVWMSSGSASKASFFIVTGAVMLSQPTSAKEGATS